MVRLDPATYRRIPWDGNVPFFLGDFVEADGAPTEVCPRQLFKKILKKAETMGFEVLTGLEYEWFNFRETPQSLAAKGYARPEPITPGMFGYSLIRAGQNQPFFQALMEEMPQIGVPLEGLHTETGPGVFEAAILYAAGVESGDRAVLFKTAAKEIGQRYGIMPSFMAKWSTQYPGCSGHVHQSLWEKKRDGAKNVFYDAKNKYRMSKVFESYLAGQLACLEDIQCFFAPTVNSYKRLVDGMWAPVKKTWGVDNRTASLRVIPGSPKSTRLETRCPGSDTNPYLALAACVASGLYGIRKGLKLKDAPLSGDSARATKIPRLPRNLKDAAENLQRSKIARELFGETFVDHYARTREWEWRQFQDAVTDWELKRYFEII
jgi:glutamine synthetase